MKKKRINFNTNNNIIIKDKVLKKKNLSIQINNYQINNKIIFEAHFENKIRNYINKKIFKKLDTFEINQCDGLKKESKHDIFIRNNKIEKIRNENIIRKLHRYEGKKKKMSIYDIKSLVDRNKSNQKIPDIKNIKVKNIKAFLNQNLKLKSNKNKSKKRRINSIRFNFHSESNNKIKNLSLSNFIKNKKHDKLKNLIIIKGIKNKINLNCINFKKNCENNWKKNNKLQYYKNKISLIKNKIKNN